MRMLCLAWLLTLAVLPAAYLYGQEVATTVPPPALTELQRAQLLYASSQVELWELRTQTAASSLERARASLQKMIVDMTPSGYRMTEKMELVKLPEPNKEPIKDNNITPK